ncbi:MAG: hypothetical protein MJ249_08065, partial [Kiritimatiellae bacterium]|nr:hypothetical protein [Kiritimatiellia bacterium]
GGFWGEQYRMLIEKWLPHCILQLEKGGHASGSHLRILARFPDRAESRLYRMSPAVAHGYREVKGAWELPLPEQKVTAIDEVKACAGQEAFQRGPLVYSWEGPNFDLKVPNYRRLNNGGESCVWK